MRTLTFMSLRALPVALLLLLTVASGPARADDLSYGYTPAPGPNENPAVLITPNRTVASLFVSITAGSKTIETTKKNCAEGVQLRIEWPRDTKVTHADVFLRASFSDGSVTETTIPIDYAFKGQLSVDLSHATADIAERTVTVAVSAPVNQADIVAYGAHKAELDRSSIAISGGPGTVTVPFVGDPAEVVILDVTLRNDSAYAGFTYSPWFLDIPHEDVLFASDSAEIASDQAYKLQATLEQLNDVVDKYGSMVPVKLYIAGCTDTVGDSGHNSELSARRADAIARWLRANGFKYPVFTFGFGESLLALPTGDGVDNAANRRALYMVGANPPPAGSGVPGVGWRAVK